MTQEEIAVDIAYLKNEVKSLKHRMDRTEMADEELTKLSKNVAELVVEMKYMRTDTQELKTAVSTMQQEPADDNKFLRRTIISSVITSMVGIIIGAVIGFIIKGGVS